MCFKQHMATKTQEAAIEYSYSEVETALARVYRLDSADGKLKGRIQHLRRLGLTPPAHGGPVAYTPKSQWAEKWLVALELAHLNVDPTTAVEFIAKSWEPPRKRDVDRAVDAGVATLGELVTVARTRTDSLVLSLQFTGEAGDAPVVGYFFVQTPSKRGRTVFGPELVCALVNE